jgi:hypothetical protein
MCVATKLMTNSFSASLLASSSLRRSISHCALKANPAGGLVELMKRKVGQVVTVPLSLCGICGRVHLLGLVIGVNLNAYDARHQWTRDAVDTGNALVDILTAGGWSKDSPMVRRYSGERTITNERIQLKRDVSGSTC